MGKATADTFVCKYAYEETLFRPDHGQFPKRWRQLRNWHLQSDWSARSKAMQRKFCKACPSLVETNDDRDAWPPRADGELPLKGHATSNLVGSFKSHAKGHESASTSKCAERKGTEGKKKPGEEQRAGGAGCCNASRCGSGS
eukprot:1643002-Rhodomonas_salina.5